jgi:hypothetical protein
MRAILYYPFLVFLGRVLYRRVRKRYDAYICNLKSKCVEVYKWIVTDLFY